MGGATWDWYLENHHSLIEYYYQLIDKNPETWILYEYLIENLIADTRLDEAEQMIKKLEQLKISAQFETAPRVFRLRYRLELKRCGSKTAEKYLTALTNTYSDSYTAWSYRADAYASLARYDEAVECYKKAIALKTPPRYTDDYISLAHIYEITKDYANAISAYKNIIEVLKTDYNAPLDGDVIQYYETKIANLTEL